jgi:hypothetical protein
MMITIYLAEEVDPEHSQRVRSGLVDKLWEHGVMVDQVVMGHD